MRYAFFSSLMVRNPVFSFADYGTINYNELIKSEFFKTALYFASTDFYNEVQKKDFEFEKLSAAQKSTIKKYCNRACFRPTPFGAFSSLSALQWSDIDESIRFHHDDIKVHLKIDYLPSLELCEKLLGQEAKDVVLYKSNSSLYKIFRYFRYIKYSTEQQKQKRLFSIVSLASNKFINEIINFCASGRSYQEIKSFVESKAGLAGADVEAFVQQLIDEQIILPRSGSNITGDDCLEDLVKCLNDNNVHSDLLTNVNEILSRLHIVGKPKVDSVLECAQLLQSIVVQQENRKSSFYVVTERDKKEGGLHVKYQQIIRDGLHCLDKLVPFHQGEALENFKQSFRDKFENREMPLLVALDPEVGIGYQNLEDVFKQDWLVKGVDFEVSTRKEGKHLKWTAVNSLLVTKMLREKNDSGLYEIELTDEDIASITLDDQHYKLPPSMSVIFRVHGKSVYLESVGGVSGTALIGRFSPFNDSFHAMATEIARKEQETNHNIVFAEIAHICDIHAANINRRRHIRDYEIPIVIGSTLDETRQIVLSDLYVSVNTNNQVVLKSKSLNAIIVPRLSTAFNHVNSELSVFRFLCDLQYQGIKSNFKLDLSNLFPGLKFYPRVVYKAAILCLATWHLDERDFEFIKKTALPEWYPAFQQLAASARLPRHFALIQHDNYLVFDRDKQEDIELFLDTIKNYTSITLQEFMLEEDATQSPIVLGDTGKPLIGQYIAALYQEENIYETLRDPGMEPGKVSQQNASQGTEWVYFKIYCHPVASNELLCQVLSPLLAKLCQKKQVNSWFYVRYKDPDYHIRLRLEVNNEHSGTVVAAISRKLKPALSKRLIDKYNIDVYVRESERYSQKLMRDVENFFFRSSNLMLYHIKKSAYHDNENDFSYDLDIIMLSADELLNAFKLDLGQRAALLSNLYENFYKEFDESKNLKKSLDKKYNELRAEMNSIYANLLLMKKNYGKLITHFFESAKIIADKIEKTRNPSMEKMIADLVHMHLNRLFVQNPRRSEMIVYYLLYKHYNALLFKSRSAAG
jgi:thiopeptide-type bacteriocin biosynthesis protein